MNFTGIRDLDLEILSKLDDEELGKICSANKYFRELCKNEDFWRNRTVQKFGKYLGSVETMNNYRSKNTWRTYYIHLVDVVYKALQEPLTYERKKWKNEDEKILDQIIVKNTEELEHQLFENFNEYKWKEILKRELIDPNKFSYGYYLEDHEENRERNEFLEYILNLNDKRINPNLALENLIYFGKNEPIVKKYLDDPRISIDSVIESILLWKGNKFNIEESSLSLFIDFIVSHNAVDELKEALDEIEDKYVLEYIYNYLGIKNKEILSEIYNILENKKLEKNDYIKILKYIKTL